MNLKAQELSTHRWQNRIVLILTDDSEAPLYQQQLNELFTDREGLLDRKLVIYTIMPEIVKRHGQTEESWSNSDSLYNSYKKGSGSFEVILIGLDGGIKLRQTEFLSNEDLFSRIDQMPMRQNELRNRG